jgi:serine/threonine-protein kinase PknG
VFAQAIDDQTLPVLAVDSADPAAAFLTNLPADTAEAVLQQIDDAVAAAQVAETVEVQLHRVKALIDVGDLDGAARELDKVEGEDPWEWRTDWLRGVAAHATRDAAAAIAAFDRCWSEVPGELAPKLALALAFEQAGDLDVASALHDLVVSTDPSYVAAARGLARCRANAGDVNGALDALARIPSTHLAYPAAGLEAVELLIAAGRHREAATRLRQLDVDAYRRAELEVALAEAALGDGMEHHRRSPSEERRRRSDLEQALRVLARLTADSTKRSDLVDRANHVRPLTLL